MALFSALAVRITRVDAARRSTSAAYNEGLWVAIYWFYMTEVSTVMWPSVCYLSLEVPLYVETASTVVDDCGREKWLAIVSNIILKMVTVFIKNACYKLS